MAGAFQTPDNERSFSALVDQVILETGRVAALRSVVQYANMTVRECQAFGLFAQDLIEESAIATAPPFSWTRPLNFRSIRAVKYGTSREMPKLRLPGRLQKDHQYYFYAADDYYVFNGVAENEPVYFANYYWAKPLVYFGKLGQTTAQYVGGPYATRPAYYDTVTEQWMYLNSDSSGYVTTLGDPVEEDTRRRNALNWITKDWYEMVCEGTKTKVFSTFGDSDRANRAFSLYKGTQTLFRNSMGLEAEVTSDPMD